MNKYAVKKRVKRGVKKSETVGFVCLHLRGIGALSLSFSFTHMPRPEVHSSNKQRLERVGPAVNSSGPG